MNTLRCRPGDLAVIVTAENLENIGALVEVIGPPGAATGSLSGDPGFLWWVRAVGRPMTYLFRDGRVERFHEGPAPDAFLRPIRGDDNPNKAEALTTPGAGPRQTEPMESCQ